MNESEPPYYGVHAPSRLNKQPCDGDRNADQEYDNKSIDLLGLGNVDKDETGEANGGQQSQSSSSRKTTRTGRTLEKQTDGLVYRQPDNPTRWSRRSGDHGHKEGLPSIPEHHPPAISIEGEQDTGTSHAADADEGPEEGGARADPHGEEAAHLG